MEKSRSHHVRTFSIVESSTITSKNRKSRFDWLAFDCTSTAPFALFRGSASGTGEDQRVR